MQSVAADQLQTLRSDMLRELREDENAVIDYLKIDVEGDELAVLQGLRDEHVPIVRQAVIEVHSKRLADDVRTYMERHGFEIAVDAGLSSGTGVRRVYAFRP